MGRDTFEGMTSGFHHMLLTSVPTGWLLMQLGDTLNFSHEKSTRTMQLFVKILNYLFDLLFLVC